jgi:1-deoxy-D-xylulose-5-phosphate synthase
MPKVPAKIESPVDLKGMTYQELDQFAAEIRTESINRVSLNGGHPASSIGAVEAPRVPQESR